MVCIFIAPMPEQATALDCAACEARSCNQSYLTLISHLSVRLLRLQGCPQHQDYLARERAPEQAAPVPGWRAPGQVSSAAAERCSQLPALALGGPHFACV